MPFKLFLLLFFSFLLGGALLAQRVVHNTPEQCGTMQRLENRFEHNPVLKSRFETQRAVFNKTVLQRSARSRTLGETVAGTIPVVFHIVLPNPDVVTDAQIRQQLDTLNKAFSGSPADTHRIPAYFRALAGRPNLQFCLAQRTPGEDPATGINRIVTTEQQFGVNDRVKHAATGGAESWNTAEYFNIWITSLTNGVLGYATFPEEGAPAEQGVVIDYRTLPGGAYAANNWGKSLVHETGHFFNLYHTWGDDNGGCGGTDYVDDTPNQSGASNTCFTGIKTDNCTASGNGIMYQNYMDYSPDACQLLFTAGQVSRMETALTTYRASLLQSGGCQPPVQRNLGVQLTTLMAPEQRLCSAAFAPMVGFRNRGLLTINTLEFSIVIDDTPVLIFQWSGRLAPGASATVTLPLVSTPAGVHTLTIMAKNPNGKVDENGTNNSWKHQYQYYEPVTTVSESFEGTAFPPPRWDIVNPDNWIGWQRVSGVAKTGNSSVMINNFTNETLGQQDWLHLPLLRISGPADSAFLSFQVAAATFTDPATTNNRWDTLEVLVSTNCGATYTSVYRKWGGNLITRESETTNSFLPLAGEWRKDSINLNNYIGEDDLLIAFRNTTGYENNIYLDDIKLRTVAINPNLKEQGFLVTPNPSPGWVVVQFYPQPEGLKSVQVFNPVGQKVREVLATQSLSNEYRFNLSGHAAGIYLVRAVFGDKVLIRKILKE